MKTMNIKKSISLVPLLLLFSFTGFAQETLSLKEAVNYALKNKSDAVKAAMDVTNSEYKIEEARSGALPQISVQGGLTYNPILQTSSLTMDGKTMNIKMGQPWQSSASVQLTQQIFNNALFIGLKAARSTREFYELNRNLTEEQVIEKVANSYYQIFRSNAQIQTVDSTIANTQRIKSVSESLYKNGLNKKIDLDRMNVSLNNLLSKKQQLINQLAQQKNTLKFLIGMNIEDDFMIAENSFQPVSGLLANDFTDINQLTEVQLLKKQAELLQFNKSAIKAQSLPTLSLSANYGLAGIGQRMPYFAGKNNGVNWSDYSGIGLNLSIPLFTGFSNRSKVKQAQIDIDKNREDLKDTRLALSLSQKNAHTQIQNSLITLNIQKENQQYAKDVVDNVTNNYRNGLATLTDLLDAENSYADAQDNYSAAALDYMLAEIQLIKSQGSLIPFFTK
ncbi:MAG: TolC family protein [Bacteroidetes bacterium]|nr:TolC family protein [Bacteroidota bacterium]